MENENQDQDAGERTPVTLEEFIAELHSMAFFKEFTFSKNEFSPNPRQELQLADNLIWMGDFLAVFQAKERNLAYVVDESSERQWFQKKVIAKASRQIRDSLRYLGEYEEIEVKNEHGHKFDIAQSEFTEVLKLIVYLPGLYLPEDCRSVKHYVSETVGFIHVINARDYLEICRTLRLPADILSYLSYRQRVLESYGQETGKLPEPLFMGQFLSTITDVPPTKDSYSYLEAFLQDVESFDLTGLIGSLHHHIERSENPYDYYQIIQEFAKLPRSMWREIKTRFMLCLEKTKIR